jgi:aminoglycoside phosphotransferase (APT) family kinase protein
VTDPDPDIDAEDEFDNGWDAQATLVDGRWVDRSPRRPEVEPAMRRELSLMPWLAPQLSLPVPVPRVVEEDPLTVRHALIVGDACAGTSAAQGAAVGSFLRDLHAVDVDEAVRHGAQPVDEAFVAHQDVRDRMQEDVLPRVRDDLRESASALLQRMALRCDEVRLVHGDLGPAHIRVVGDRVGGVIDWMDAHVGDPALDLAWTAYGASPAFVDALVTAYEPDDDLLARGLDWHLMGPWHEVLYGLDIDEPAYVVSGLAGVESRLAQHQHPTP